MPSTATPIVAPTWRMAVISADPAPLRSADSSPRAAFIAAGMASPRPIPAIANQAAVNPVLLPAEQLTGPRASGLLVPPVEGRLVKAATFSSIKWPWLAERLAGAGLHAVRLSVGRLGEEATLQRDDADVAAEAVADLAGLLGRPRLDPVSVTVTRWGGALPQYTPGHLDRVVRLRAALAAAGGLAMAGGVLDGLGVAACIASADRAVADLLTGLVAARGTIDA